MNERPMTDDKDSRTYSAHALTRVNVFRSRTGNVWHELAAVRPEIVDLHRPASDPARWQYVARCGFVTLAADANDRKPASMMSGSDAECLRCCRLVPLTSRPEGAEA